MMEIDTSQEISVSSDLQLMCDRDAFVARLGIVSRAVSTRSTVQVLAGIRLTAGNGALELAATDMEVSLRASLVASVASEGSVVVP